MPLFLDTPTVKLSDLTPEFLKKHYFHGINLTDQQGKPIPDETFKYYLKVAISQTEHELDIDIIPQTYSGERHPYFRNDFYRFGAIKLNKRPIKSVGKVQMMITEYKIFEIPLDWLQIDNARGTIWVIPAMLRSVPMTTEGFLISPWILGNLWAPQMWVIDYSTGYTADDLIPADLADVICMRAAIQIFNELGDIVIGAGIANFSLGLDGYSQSIGTTASAMYAAYSARIEMYKKNIQELLPKLYSYYRGIELYTL